MTAERPSGFLPMAYYLSVIAERWGERPRNLDPNDDDVKTEIAIIQAEGFERWWRRGRL